MYVCLTREYSADASSSPGEGMYRRTDYWPHVVQHDSWKMVSQRAVNRKVNLHYLSTSPSRRRWWKTNGTESVIDRDMRKNPTHPPRSSDRVPASTEVAKITCLYICICNNNVKMCSKTIKTLGGSIITVGIYIGSAKFASLLRRRGGKIEANGQMF